MPHGSLGSSVALGLLADGDDFSRIRQRLSSGRLRGLWQAYLRHLGAEADCASLAFAAAVTRERHWQDAALKSLLAAAHAPISAFVDSDAGCISLSGMHRAHNICLAADWLWPVLNRDQREAVTGAAIAKCAENLSRMPDGIRDESDQRGQLLFARRLDRDDPFCLHPRDEQVNNWDFWFAGGLYMIACLAERAYLQDSDLVWGHYYDTGYDLDEARVARWKSIARERIETGMRNQLGPDGDYAEGISYAAYGGNALIVALTAMQRIDGIDLFSEALYRMPLWRRGFMIGASSAIAPNFNDAKLTAQSAPRLTAMLARRSRDPRLQGLLLDELDQDISDPGWLLILGLDESLPAEKPVLPRTRATRHTGTVIWRPDITTDGLFVALQSGVHGGAHQHRDRNSFFLAADGYPLLVDTGDCRYLQPPDPSFIDTMAHNALLIDGQGQIGDNHAPVAGRMVEQQDHGPISTALFDAGACYERITHCYRRAILNRPDILVLGDRVEGDCHEITWLAQGYNADGQARWRCKGRHMVLLRPELSLYLFFLQEPAGASIATSPLDGEARGILRLAVTIPGNRVTAVLATRRADEDAPVAAWSDGALSVTCRGRTVSIREQEKTLEVNGTDYAC